MSSATVYKNKALVALERGSAGGSFPCTLSISFYNNLRALDLQLSALSRQTFRDFELIIGDDGSPPEVVEAIRPKLDGFPIPARHLHHEKRGFRKNRMLNRVIAESRSDYLIFIDQDCLPHRRFVEEHFESRLEKSVLCGRRMELTRWASALLTPENVAAGFIEKNFWRIAASGIFTHDSNGSKGIHVRNRTLRRLLNRRARGILGCNFSLHKQDLLDINGFDWRYEYPGTGEDSDIEFRLRRNGVKMVSFAYAAVQYHLFHPLTKKNRDNEALFAGVCAAGKAATEFGLREQLAMES